MGRRLDAERAPHGRRAGAAAPSRTLGRDRLPRRVPRHRDRADRGQLGLLGSDVRIRAELPSQDRGGPGDDLIVGGPSEDAIDGGPGQDIIAGGPGADVLSGGPGEDLVTYDDRIAADGTLLPRRSGVRMQVGRPDWSGSGDERDTIGSDVEQLQGGAGADRLSLRDGRATQVACGAGRDRSSPIRATCSTSTATARPSHRSPAAPRLTVPTLPFPFPGVERQRSQHDTCRAAAAAAGQRDRAARQLPRGPRPAGARQSAAVHRPRALHALRRRRDGHPARKSPARRRDRPAPPPHQLARARAPLRAASRSPRPRMPDRGSVSRALKFRVRG